MKINDFYGKEIWTLQETASYLRMHRSTVSRMVAEGIIKAHRIGGRVLFRRDDIRQLFDKSDGSVMCGQKGA